MKVYKFGLLAPTTNNDLVRSEMKKAHNYQNKLIEIERWRRDQKRAIEYRDDNIRAIEIEYQRLDGIVESLLDKRASLKQEAFVLFAQQNNKSPNEIKANKSLFDQAKKFAKKANDPELNKELEAAKIACKVVKDSFYQARGPVRIAEQLLSSKEKEGDSLVKLARENGKVLSKQDRLKLIAEAKSKADAILKELSEENAICKGLLELKTEVSERTSVIRGDKNIAPWYGSYMLIEKAFDLTRRMSLYDGLDPKNPRFRRFDGGGRIGIQQFQPHEPIDKVVSMNPTSKFVQIVPISSTPIKKDGSKKKVGNKDLRLLRLRIGTHEDQSPIWADFPMVYHRPIPIGVNVASVQVVMTKVGSREVWAVSITVDQVSEKNTISDQVIAFDLGWRMYPNQNKIVIATGHDTNNQEIEIAVSDQLLKQLLKVDELKSVRDKEFDLIRSQLVSWLKSSESILPDWLVEDAKTLYKWKSKSRLVKLINNWNENRFIGDESIMGTSGHWKKTLTRGNGLLGWKYHDFHLWNWETSQSRKARLSLRDFYRTEAAKLASKYGAIVFENIKGNTLARGKVGGHNRQLTAPFEFRSISKMIFGGRGKNYEEVPAQYSSMDCSDIECGHRNEKTAALEFFCDKCGKEIHRDKNAAKNLLARYLLRCERSSGEEKGGIARNNDIKQLATVEPTFEEREKLNHMDRSQTAA